MKSLNYFLFILVALLTIFFTACGESTTSGTDTKDTSDNDSVVTEAEITENITENSVSLFIGKNDISEFSIVVNDSDITGKNVAEYFAGQVKVLTGKDIEVVNSSGNNERAIFIGANAIPGVNHEMDEFVIKFVEENLYISYSEDASAFQAVSSVLDDVLFASHNRDGDTFTLSENFEFSGKCGDYIIGDNEFNPFE